MKDEVTIRFVREHRDEDVRQLALQTRRDGDVDLQWALEQIQGWQTARRKLPSWAAVDGLVFPPRLSMEQCSSEQTALYKCRIMESLPIACRTTLVDLTGGYGVDFAFMARNTSQAIYVERQERLCDIARHNFGLLGIDHATIVQGEAEEFIKKMSTDPASTLIYIDPARRDDNSNRTYAIEDCTPNVLAIKEQLLGLAHRVLIKLSPMLDWHKVISDLGGHVAQLHLVSVGGECRELLVLMDSDHEGSPVICCVNDNQHLSYDPSQETNEVAIAHSVADWHYLYEPNPSIMKAGCFDVITSRFPVQAVAIDSHLFVSDELIPDFPGRCFMITGITSMNKKELSVTLRGIRRANVAVRNFPMTAQELKVRLRLVDGCDCYIFGTTTNSGNHILLLCKKPDI